MCDIENTLADEKILIGCLNFQYAIVAQSVRAVVL